METKKIWEAVKNSFQPTPINPPTVDPDLEHLQPLARSTESLRFGILSLEYWVSKGGKLRVWVKNNVLLASLLAVPVLIVMPLIGLLLFQLVWWIGMLIVIAGHLIILPALVLVAIVIILIIINLIKSLFSQK